MNIDEVSCVAEFCDFTTLVNIMKVDEEYKDLCERNMVESDEILRQILEQDNIEAFCKYIEMYNPRIVDNENVYHCKSPITFRYFYLKEHNSTKIYETCIREGNFELFKFLFKTMKLGGDDDKLFTEACNLSKVDIARYILDNTRSNKIYFEPLMYFEYSPEILSLINDNIDKLSKKRFHKMFCFSADSILKYISNIFYRHSSDLLLKYATDIFCKCDPPLNGLITIELVKVIVEMSDNKRVFLTRLLNISRDEDYIIELLKIFERYNIVYRTSRFISEMWFRVIEYIINKTERDLIFNLGDRYFHQPELLQKLADTGRLYIDSDSINYSRKFFTWKVDEILMSLPIKEDCKCLYYDKS
ncbi:hypothetical protein D3C87_920510 [compost metagenome]